MLHFRSIIPLTAVIFSALTFFAQAASAQAQPDPWHTKAREAAAAEKTGRTEQEVLYCVNLVRTDPQRFREEYFLPHITTLKAQLGPSRYRSYARYVDSLDEELKKLKPMDPVKPKAELAVFAQEHAEYSGKKGIVGHDWLGSMNFDRRCSKHNLNGVGEVCNYGADDPMEIVLDLLIDQGVPSLGHRKIILDPKYAFAGVGIAPHKVYRTNCVIDFQIPARTSLAR